MTDNVQIKVFFGIVLLAFFGAFYFRDNLSPKAKDIKYEDAINEAWDYCSEDKSYLDNLENRICVMNYLVDAKGISIKELNDYRIRQEQKNK